jgi:hypothetical protein
VSAKPRFQYPLTHLWRDALGAFTLRRRGKIVLNRCRLSNMLAGSSPDDSTSTTPVTAGGTTTPNKAGGAGSASSAAGSARRRKGK